MATKESTHSILESKSPRLGSLLREWTDEVKLITEAASSWKKYGVRLVNEGQEHFSL